MCAPIMIATVIMCASIVIFFAETDILDYVKKQIKDLRSNKGAKLTRILICTSKTIIR